MTDIEQRHVANAYTFSVWCGGSEINDHYLTEQQAADLAAVYIADGYDDIAVVNYRNVGGL